MKSLIIANNLGVGGAQKMAKYVCHSLGKYHNCKIVGLFSRKNVETNGEIIQLCPSKTSYFIVVRQLRTLLKIESPDLLVAFGTDAIIVSFFASRGLRIKILGSERNDPDHLSFPWKVASRLVYPRCDGFSFQLDEVRAFYRMQPSQTVQVIPNAYFGKQYTTFVKADLRDKEITCASARIDHQKGLDVLLKAFSIVHKEYPEYMLSIFGELKNWSELDSEIESLGIGNNVVFKGQTESLSDSIYTSRCFVLPSRFEGIPNAMIEAMAAGVPTVSCDCPPGGPRMLTEDGESGLLCKVEDYVGMANSICRLIEDDSLCDSLSERAQTVQERFASSIISQRWVELCNKVLMSK